MAKGILIIPELSSKDLERFWSKVDKNGPFPAHCPELGNCWLWIGAKTIGRYGNFKIKKQPYQAHRISFVVHAGRNPEPGMFILHKCDNMQCVRGDHLEENDHDTNMEQAKARKRFQTGDGHYTRRRPELLKRGDSHPGSLMTEALVKEMRFRYLTDRTISTLKMAKEYGFAEETIRKALLGKNWGHVPGIPETYPARIRGPRGPYNWKNPWKSGKPPKVS